jgi:MFS family permease
MAVEVEEPKQEIKSSKLPSLWRNRDFMLLWSGQMVSGLGSNMTNLAMPLLILAITNSPQTAGIAGAFSYIPYVLFSLPAGALMDRWDRKRVMIICDIVRAINIASVPVAAGYGVLTIWQIYVNTFVEGCAYVFFSISETAALPQVVERQQLPAAYAQNNAGFGLMELIGAPVAGFLYNTIGRLVPFIFDAVSYSASVISLTFIRVQFQTERAKTERHLWNEIKEGMGWLWSRPIIRVLAVLAAGVNLRLFSAYLIVIVMAQDLHANAFQLGLLFSVAAGAGIIGSLIGGIIQRRFSFVQVIIGTRILTTLIFPLYLFASNIFLLGLVTVTLYLLDPIYDVVQYSYRLALIPDHLRGRVNSSFRLIAWGARPIAAALTGILLEQAGATATVLVFSIVGVFFMLPVFSPAVRKAPPLD